jgi:ABC-type multidrug transport system fused ATPase/permease subunit
MSSFQKIRVRITKTRVAESSDSTAVNDYHRTPIPTGSALSVPDDGADEHRVYEMPWSVYGSYVKMSGGACVAFAIIFLMLLNMSANLATNRFLAFWADEHDPDHTFFLLMYTTCALGSVLCLLLSMWSLMSGGLRAARRMHRQLLASVLRVSIAFYEQNGAGSGVSRRVLNRFAHDIHTIDEKLSYTFNTFLSTVFTVCILLFL